MKSTGKPFEFNQSYFMIKVFKFGLLPPTTNGNLVREQMYNAHKYHNEIIKLENDKRAELRKVGGNIEDCYIQ